MLTTCGDMYFHFQNRFSFDFGSIAIKNIFIRLKKDFAS